MEFSLVQRDRTDEILRAVIIEDHPVMWVRRADATHRLVCTCEREEGGSAHCKHKGAARAMRACELQEEYGIRILGDADRTPDRLAEVVLDLACRAAAGEWVGQFADDLELRTVACIIDVPPDGVWRYIQAAIETGALVVDRNAVRAG